MEKRLILGLVVFLLVLSIFVLAEEGSGKECGFFCKAGKLLWGTGSEEKALAGKAGG